jgi:Zn-dependent protease with chaperone function
VLLALMTVAVLATGSAIYGVWAFSDHLRPTRSPLDDLPPLLSAGQAWLVCVLAVAAFVGAASLWRMRSLHGGTQLAERLGGRLVSGQPRDGLERRLLNVVEEMSIAAGVPVPSVFVLDDELGINAFAAGFEQADAAIAVTRGCLEKLTRDELQGVIAHELSHVLNGDMQLNLRLMGVVYGIVCIGLFGRLLLNLAAGRSFLRKRNPFAIVGMFGVAVVVIGYIGELCGKLIKAAVSRQREHLADASAVQFTRNPGGIAGALRKIGGHSQGARVNASGAGEASHFFFGEVAAPAFFFPGMFATHPALGERIRRIDPSFRGEFPEVPAGIAEPADTGVAAFGAASPAGASFAAPRASTVADHVGTADETAVEHGARILNALPPALREAASQPYTACALVYALLLGDDPALRTVQLEQLTRAVGPGLARETERCARLLAPIQRRDRLPLIELLAPALRALSAAQRATFNAAVRQLIAADERMSIFEYVVAHTLEHALTPRSVARGQQRSLAAVRAEIELLLSLLAHAGGADGGAAQGAFTTGAERLLGLRLALLPSSPRLLSALWPALDALRALSPPLRSQVVDACAHTTLANRDVSENEWTLLRAVCGALECPLPPSWH